MRIWIGAALLLSLLLAGCADNPATSAASGGARWGEYKSFGFVPESGAHSQVKSILKTEVARQLNARGMVQSGDPDLLVSLSVQTEKRLKVRGVSGTTGGAAARYPFLVEYYRQLPPGHATDIDEYTEGRLTIDILDVRQKKMIWRGRTQGRITQKMMANPRATLAAAVDEIFRKFPVPRSR